MKDCSSGIGVNVWVEKYQQMVLNRAERGCTKHEFTEQREACKFTDDPLTIQIVDR